MPKSSPAKPSSLTSSGIELGAWSNARGSCRLVLESPRAIRIVCAGKLQTQVMRELLDRLGMELSAARGMHTYWDLEGMENYEPGVRTESMRVLLTHWDRVMSVRAFAHSSLVKMGIAVANLGLKNRVEAFDTRAEFEESMRAAIDAR